MNLQSFFLRGLFPESWNAFQSSNPPSISFTVNKELFPYQLQNSSSLAIPSTASPKAHVILNEDAASGSFTANQLTHTGLLSSWTITGTGTISDVEDIIVVIPFTGSVGTPSSTPSSTSS